ncbi:hypothetical protein BpHYR1_011729 [Brachionus plicatilis]|uniref:Uncharacterized protein n=1 Tax=Brachionus plicatilis TaxID=10195 RepID=A0A3M7Q7B7_BRAPC|nr:hypothetical protein BpHYR1_011729 [Brachionus plicatilis]
MVILQNKLSYFEIFYHMPKCLIHRTKAQLIKRLNDYITLNGINVGQVENEEQVEERSEEEEEFTDVQINTPPVEVKSDGDLVEEINLLTIPKRYIKTAIEPKKNAAVNIKQKTKHRQTNKLTDLFELKFSSIMYSPLSAVSKMPIAPDTYLLALCLMAYLLVASALFNSLYEPLIASRFFGGDCDLFTLVITIFLCTVLLFKLVCDCDR